MITENDIKALRLHETRSGKIVNVAVIVAPIFLVIMGVLNLGLASRIGGNVGVELYQLFQSWIEGVDVTKQYHGMYVKAMERLTTALLQFGLAFVLSIVAYCYHRKKKMYARILKTLTSSGMLKD
jgi:fumarate reductase subunit D